MGRYPESEHDLRVAVDRVAPIARAIFAACGMRLNPVKNCIAVGSDSKTKLPELWPKLTLDKMGRELYYVEVVGCLNFLSVEADAA